MGLISKSGSKKVTFAYNVENMLPFKINKFEYSIPKSSLFLVNVMFLST